MLLGNVNNICVGTRKVLKVYVGGTQVWPRGGGGKYLNVSPEEVQWMLSGNGWKVNYDVKSNTSVRVGMGTD